MLSQGFTLRISSRIKNPKKYMKVCLAGVSRPNVRILLTYLIRFFENTTEIWIAGIPLNILFVHSASFPVLLR